jgi:hypothetical protein
VDKHWESTSLWILYITRNSKQLENRTFRELDLFPSSGEGMETATLLGPLERTNLTQLKIETAPVSETLYFLVILGFRKMAKVKKPDDSE